MSAAIRFDHVRKSFLGDDREVLAIENLSFEVSEGEYVTILGRSGGGKSTAFNLLLGLLAPTSGRVELLGTDPVRQFDALRGRVACVFQHDRLLPWRSALANVRLPLEILHLDERSLEVGPEEWLRRLGLADFENALPHQLSGGMRQRVALARALVSDPDVVLADEAFSSLDAVTGEHLRQEFRRLAKETGKTVLHITHSIDEAVAVSDRILVLAKPGRLLAQFPGPEDRTNEAEREQLRRAVLQTLNADATDRAVGAAA